MNVYTSRINISIPTQFLKAVDKAALAQGMNRSTFIRVALREKMGLKDMINLEAYIDKAKVRPKDSREPSAAEREEAVRRLEKKHRFWSYCDEELKRCLIDMELDTVK